YAASTSGNPSFSVLRQLQYLCELTHQDALSLAKMLEDKKLWRRAATVYTSMLGMATTANELWLLARMRNRCLRNVARW
ncbi:PerC family transcriptional regulator, partial [Klebsiella pneumoniae]